MPPDEPSNEERQEELPEDNQTPFTMAATSRDDAVEPDSARQNEANKLDDTHPVTDNANSLQSEELYDEGLSGAAEASEPNAGNAVVGYTPPQDTSAPVQAGDDDDDQDGNVAINPS